MELDLHELKYPKTSKSLSPSTPNAHKRFFNRQFSENSRVCGLCCEHVKLPKQLPCFHTFCRKCLETYVDENKLNNTVACPSCRKTTAIPPGGPSGFSSNFYVLTDGVSLMHVETGHTDCTKCGNNEAIGYCLECQINMCFKCKEMHKSEPATKTHHILIIGGRESQHSCRKLEKRSFCVIHNDQEIKFHCRNCDVTICRDCRLTAHNGHEARDIAVVAKEDRVKLAEYITTLKECLPRYEEAVKNANKVKENFLNHANEVLEDIEKQRDELHASVDEACDKNSRDLHGLQEKEIEVIDEQIEELDEDYNLIRRSIETTEPVMEIGEDVKIVKVRKEIERLVRNLPPIKAIPEKQFIFSQATAESDIQSLAGRVGIESKTLTMVTGMSVDSLFNYSITAINEHQVWLTRRTGGGSDAVKLDFTGDKPVRDWVHLQPYGSYHVATWGDGFVTGYEAGSEIALWSRLKKPHFKFFCRINQPLAGIAVNSNNHVLVSLGKKPQGESSQDETPGAICCYDPHGDLLAEARLVDEKPIFGSPSTLAVNVNGDVVVCDKERNVIHVLDSNLKPMAVYSPDEKAQQGRPFHPFGLCCDCFGRIIVTDPENDCLHLLDPSGRFLRILLSAEDGLDKPTLVAVAPGGHLWVVGRNGIRVFSYPDSL